MKRLIESLRTRRWCQLIVANLRIMLGFAFRKNDLKQWVTLYLLAPALAGVAACADDTTPLDSVARAQGGDLVPAQVGEGAGPSGQPDVAPRRKLPPSGQRPDGETATATVPMPDFLNGKIPGTTSPGGTSANAAPQAAGGTHHGHFHTVLEMSTKHGLEVAERNRLVNLNDLSLVTRLRSHGARRAPAEPLPEGVPDLRKGLGIAASPPNSQSSELRDLTGKIQEVTSRLDLLPDTDPRFAALVGERERLHERRRQLLNEEWQFVDSVYIPTYVFELQPRMVPKVVMLYYLVTDDHTDLLVVPPQGDVVAHRLPAGYDNLVTEAAAVQASRHRPSGRRPGSRGVAVIDDGPVADPSAAARRLYDLLIAPAEAEVAAAEHVVIVADEPLTILPFAALRRPGSDGESYLIEWKPLSLSPSAAAYRTLVDQRTREPGEPLRGNLVALANPAYQPPGRSAETAPVAVRSARGFSGLSPLPGSEREVEQIARLFDRRALETKLFLGGEATEGILKQRAGTASVLHLAVHGYAHPDQPEHSLLALSVPSNPVAEPENGVLEGWEIVDELRLDADLVALSACQTALGRGRGGEGIESLGRSFLGAGARSVLASLWKVDDAATADLMVSFYRHLLDGSPKDEALQKAQIDLLRNRQLGYQAPHYWAGFQLIGDWL